MPGPQIKRPPEGDSCGGTRGVWFLKLHELLCERDGFQIHLILARVKRRFDDLTRYWKSDSGWILCAGDGTTGGVGKDE